MATHPLDVVIMAAGKGTRMKSSLPKVLHRLGGRALLVHVMDCAAQLSARQAVVITGHGATEVEAACAGRTGAAANLSLKFARQEPQLGTGHAVQHLGQAAFHACAFAGGHDDDVDGMGCHEISCEVGEDKRPRAQCPAARTAPVFS